MILPEDTKAPIDSDDEEVYESYEDFEDAYYVSPAQSRPLRPIHDYTSRDSTSFDDERSNYLYPLSPGASTHPLLPFPDAELGPAPPYSARDDSTSHQSSFKRRRHAFGKIKSLRIRLLVALGFATLVYIILSSTVSLGFRIFGHRPRPHHGPYDPRPGDDKTPENGGEDGDGGDQSHRDGSRWACANFTEESVWSWTGIEKDGYRQAGSNVTMLIPLGREDEVFTHLAGPAAIGPMILGSYDAESKDQHRSDIEEEGVIIGPSGFHGDHGKNGGHVEKGEYVKIIIENLFDVSVDLDDDSGKGMTEEKSPGWEMLRWSSVCLMDRRNGWDRDGDEGGNGTRMEVRRAEEDHRLQDGLGVGIYTHKPNPSIHLNPPNNPLRFRIHVLLPSYDFQSERHSSVQRATSSPSLHPLGIAHSILESLSTSGETKPEHKHHWAPNEPPKNYVSSLDLNGGVSEFIVGDLRGVELGHLKMESAVGTVDFGSFGGEGVRAEKVEVKVVGTISGWVGVSESLFIDSPVGEIDLNLSLISPPEHVLHVSPPSGPPPELPNNSTLPPPVDPRGRIDVCTLPPVKVVIRTGSDSIKLRHGRWEIPCRGVKEDIKSLVGSIDVYPHALFQGAYKLGTAVGGISVSIPDEPIPDPEDKGRTRRITIDKQDRLGSKQWSGNVKWKVDADDDENDEEGEEESVAVAGRKIVARRKRSGKQALEVYTSTGSIGVVF